MSIGTYVAFQYISGTPGSTPGTYPKNERIRNAIDGDEARDSTHVRVKRHVRRMCCSRFPTHDKESIMQAWKLLFSSDVGLFSVAVFIVLFAMIGYFTWLFSFKKDTSDNSKA